MPIPAPHISYNVNNWYWVVAGSASEVWSSQAVAYVPMSDPVYLHWQQIGGIATAIGFEEDLWDVLAQQAPQLVPPQGLARLQAYLYTQIGSPNLSIFLDHENRVRLVENKPPLNATQFGVVIRPLLGMEYPAAK